MSISLLLTPAMAWADDLDGQPGYTGSTLPDQSVSEHDGPIGRSPNYTVSAPPGMPLPTIPTGARNSVSASTRSDDLREGRRLRPDKARPVDLRI